ncbi:hypothetical protein [uncultured Clostridium sp.]|uniref:hypothetical protein n=1 Tax=uncultured Clostridium sp. TaxID=59620 RepID=UPI00263A8FBF|nr:hypothetical protein [uncultured Clostridium sp.]
MGKFTNSSYVDELDSLQTGFKENILDNPFYKYNAVPESIVTYYSLDKENSTLDEAANNIETYIDRADSPIKYRKIENFIIYGLEKVILNLDIGEFGLENSDISGEGMIITGTIIPYSGDLFTINHTNTELLFRVINSQPDTLPNGANCYKVEYKLFKLDKVHLEDNLTGEYTFLHNNVGTELNPVIEKDKYKELYELDRISNILVEYYKDMFYDSRVNSFIYRNKELRFYDAILTQFLIDTDILNNTSDKYLYLSQQIKTEKDFNIKYNRSFYNALIRKNKDIVDRVDSFCYGELIESKIGIFYTRPEEYFSMKYERIDMNPTFLHCLTYDIFDRVFLNNVIKNVKYGDNKTKFLHNIIIKYFNDENISKDDLKNLEYLDFLEDNVDLFYYIPCVIYIIEQEIRSILDLRKSVFLK